MERHHRESAALIGAPPHEVFAFVDDHARFSSHMSQSSWMMGGGRMSIDLDGAKGQAVGSPIRLSGTVSGCYPSRSRPPDSTDGPVWETVALGAVGDRLLHNGDQMRPRTTGRTYSVYRLRPSDWMGDANWAVRRSLRTLRCWS